MHAVAQRILGLKQSGIGAFAAADREAWDPDIDGKGHIRPLLEIIEEDMASELGAPVLFHTLATGPTWSFRFLPDNDAAVARRVLRDAGLLFEARDDGYAAGRLDETLAMLKAFDRALYRMSATEASPRLKFLAIFENADALFCDRLPPEYVIPIQQATEILASNFNARRHDALFCFWTTRHEALPAEIRRALPLLRVAQPGFDEKLAFVRTAAGSDLRREATLTAGLDLESVAAISAGTPNLWVEQVFFRSAHTRSPITAPDLVEQKRHEIERLSDGTLRLLRGERTRAVRLCGRMIARPLQLLTGWAKRLRQGQLTPANVLVPGPVSSGKTDLATIVALDSGLPAFALVSPKSQWVGSTERRTDVMFRMLNEAAPCLSTCDEITDLLPTTRGDGANDSGASNAVHAGMLNHLSDKSRMGRQLLIGMTNEPERMSQALASRFVVVPALGAISADYPAIMLAIAETIDPKFQAAPTDPRIIAAAGVFFEKHVLPRNIRDVITSILTLDEGPLSPELLLDAANCAAEGSSAQRRACEWADLVALRQCSCARYLPWHGCEESFPYPPHVRAVLAKSGAAGRIDPDALDARIAGLRPRVNI